MRKYLFSVLTFFVCAFCADRVFAQTPTFGNVSGGLASSISIGQNQQAIFGFSVNVNTGSLIFKEFDIVINQGTPATSYTNATLYRSSSSSSYSSGTPVGNVTLVNSGSVTITNLQETVTTTTVYYFLVVDVVASGSNDPQLRQNYGDVSGYDINGNSYTTTGSNYKDYNYSGSVSSPYAVSLAYNSNGLTSSSTSITAGTTGNTLYAFSITNRSASSITFNKLQIQTNGVSDISQYFTNIQLYNGTSTAKSSAISGISVTSTSGGYLVLNTGTAVSVAAGATSYFYLVMDAKASFMGSVPANVQFAITDQQSSTALTTSSTTYNDFTAIGNTYNINAASLTVTNLTGGLSSGTLTYGQTGVVLFGFSIATSSSSIAVTNFNINSTNTPGNYFGNAILYRCNNTNYASASSKVAVGTVTFSGNYANVAFTTNETITSSSANQNYFLVADNSNAAANSTTTIAFNFTSAQSQAAIIQTSPVTSYNSYSFSGNTLTLPGPTFLLTGENSSSNGITQGSLAYGQTGIVLFGVGIEAIGTSLTMTTINFHTTGSEDNYFSNYSVYRSTSPVFPGGTPLYTSSSVAGCNCGHVAATVNETIPANTTYYYFLTADFTVGTGTIPSTFEISFASGQSPVAITGSSGTYNTYNIAGTTFNLANAESWTGATNDFGLASNFKATNGGSGFVPTSSTIVNIGGAGVTYTVAPVIKASTTIGGLIFGGSSSPTLTINSGQTLTVNTSMQVNATTVGITGPGALALGSSAVTNTSASTTLNLSGGVTVSNAGTFNTGTSSNITLAGNSTLTNSGTFTLASTAAIGTVTSSIVANTGSGIFTLASDASSSARIGQVTGTGAALNGTFSVQRFITGGSGMRGYRLMSSPTGNGTGRNSYPVYSVNYVAQSSYITGTTPSTNGIDKAGNPTLYLFRENLTPNQSSFTAGNFRGIGNMGTTTTNTSYTIDVDGSGYDIPVGNGYLFFFRGDRSAATVGQETVTTYVPTNTTLTAVGTLNYGAITYKNWYTDLGNLLFTNTAGNSSIQGYNLLGNPYASSISWTSLYNANTTNLSNTMYAYNPATAHYGSFQAGGSGTQGVNDIIGSGQGFFAVATNTGAAVTFSEAVKSTSQPTTLLMGIPVNTAVAPQYIHIKMVKDSVNYDDAIVGFTTNADTKYVENEDAVYLNGNSPPEVFSTLSSDSVNLSINNVPLPGQNGSIVKLNVSASNSGTFTFKRSELVGIPTLYQIWLKDNLQKDSIDFRANDTYSFAIDNSNPASYGANRFQLVFRQSPGLALHLLNFTGSKAAGVPMQSQLTWTVENESNYTTFYMQRSTDGGKTFSSVGSLQSDGTGTYTFVDKNPVLGENMYRLQLDDLNNNLSYSQIIIIQFSDLSNSSVAGTLSVFPNPAHSTVNIDINSAGSANGYSLLITNSSGVVVKRIAVAAPSSQQDVSSLVPGTYYITMINNGTKTAITQGKFVKL